MTSPSLFSSTMDWLPLPFTDLGEASVLYASHGFRVLPVWWTSSPGVCACGPDCSTPGKHPIEGAWQKKATSNVDDVRSQRSRYPFSNIGVALGGHDRIIALDIDGPSGRATLERLEAERGPLPPTLTSRTGRKDGGEHRLFRAANHHDMGRIKNRARVNGLDGIDTRGDGGQILVSPSTHASGARYEWTLRVPIATIPDWLFEALATPPPTTAPAPSTVPLPASANSTRRYIQAAIDRAQRDISAAHEGERNSKLFAKGCTIFEYCVGEGMALDDARAALKMAGIACGLSEREVDRTLNGSLAKAQANPKRVPLRAVPSSSDSTASGSSSAQVITDDGEILDDDPPPPSDGLPAPSPQDWRQRLLWKATKTGVAVDKSVVNVRTILKYCPEWLDGIGRPKVRMNLFSHDIWASDPPWHDDDRPSVPTGFWTSSDNTRFVMWVKRNLDVEFDAKTVEGGVTVAAESSGFHPVRDWMDSLQWDGVPRLERWLHTYLGAVDDEYTRSVGAWWLISGAARTYEPGVQADYVLILEGPQGIRKSTALRALAGAEWFGDTPFEIGSKDGYEVIQGKLIVELAELQSLMSTTSAKAKAFFSSPVDDYCPKYMRRPIKVPRKCIFAGTVNHKQYLQDPTGNRRYWPVECSRADVEALKRDRAQLWAEAVAHYKRGAKWHPELPAERDMCEQRQETASAEDEWENLIERWLKGKTGDVAIADVLEFALKLPPERWTRAEQTRVGMCLSRIGWSKVRRTVGEKRQWYWIRCPTVANVFRQVSHQIDQQ